MLQERNKDGLYYLTTGRGFVVVDLNTNEVLSIGNLVTCRRPGDNGDPVDMKPATYFEPVYFKEKTLAEKFITGEWTIATLQERLMNLNIMFTFQSIIKK